MWAPLFLCLSPWRGYQPTSNVTPSRSQMQTQMQIAPPDDLDLVLISPPIALALAALSLNAAQNNAKYQKQLQALQEEGSRIQAQTDTFKLESKQEKEYLERREAAWEQRLEKQRTDQEARLDREKKFWENRIAKLQSELVDVSRTLRS
jgi:hypothetical protein